MDTKDSFENANSCSCFVEFNRPLWFAGFLTLFTSYNANPVEVGVYAFCQGRIQSGVVLQGPDALKDFVVVHHVVLGLEVLGNFFWILGM
jgi:uncharacterized membrane protein